MLEPCQQQHLAPELHQHLHQRLRQHPPVQAQVEFLLHAPSRLHGARQTLLGIAGALLKQFVATALILIEGEKILEQLGEQLRIFSVIVEQTLDDALDSLLRPATRHLFVSLPAQRRGGNLVEQAPRRVVGAAEQAPVEQGHFQQRNMQTREQFAQVARQVVVSLDKVEEQADQVDHIFIVVADPPAAAAAYADPQQQLFQLLAQVEVVGISHAGHVVLQMRQQPQQIGGIDWLGSCHALQARRETPASRRQQRLQAGEEVLASTVAVGRIGLGVTVSAVQVGQRPVFGAAPRRGHQFGQDAGCTEQLIGFAVQQIKITQHIAFEQLEQDQLDLRANPQAAPGIQKEPAQALRAQRIAAQFKGHLQQRLEAQAELIKGKAITRQHPRQHALDGRRPLGLGSVAQRFGNRQIRYALGLADTGEGVIERIEKLPLDTLALQPQVAHRFEVEVLIDPLPGPVGHLEQPVVSIVEQRLQALAQLQDSLVPYLQEHDRKAQRGHARTSVGGRHQGHHLAFCMHP